MVKKDTKKHLCELKITDVCAHVCVFKHVLGWRFDLLAILQPFDLDIWTNYLTPQDNLLALFHWVARFKLLQESWGCRQKGKGINKDWTTHQFIKTFLLLFFLSNFMVYFLLPMPLPCCTSISTSPEVKSHFPVQFIHISNASLLHSLLLLITWPDLPSLCLGSTFIFFRRFSMPLRSVMPYSKAIFSYSLGWAFLSNSHTSISGSSFLGFFLSVKENGYVYK